MGSPETENRVRDDEDVLWGIWLCILIDLSWKEVFGNNQGINLCGHSENFYFLQISTSLGKSSSQSLEMRIVYTQLLALTFHQFLLQGENFYGKFNIIWKGNFLHGPICSWEVIKILFWSCSWNQSIISTLKTTGERVNSRTWESTKYFLETHFNSEWNPA